MKNRWALIASILLGSYFVHCTQSMVTSMSGGRHDGGGGTKDSAGAIGDAHAETGGGTCCTAPDREAPTVLFDDLVEPTPVAGTTNCTLNSPVIDISGYRSIVVHSPKCDYRIQVRNGKAGFVNALLATCDGNRPEALGRVSTIDSIMGRELRVNFGESTHAGAPDGSASCSSTPVAITIVGLKHP